MHASKLSLWCGSLVLLLAGIIGCAPSSTGNPVSATTTKSDSASFSGSMTGTAAQFGPGASYDAGGVCAGQRHGDRRPDPTRAIRPAEGGGWR